MKWIVLEHSLRRPSVTSSTIASLVQWKVGNGSLPGDILEVMHCDNITLMECQMNKGGLVTMCHKD